METVAAFAAENLDREIQRQIVGVLSRQREVADPDLGLDGAGAVDDDDAAGWRRRVDRLRRHAPANASSGVTSPTIARIELFAPNQVLWNATRSSRVMLAIDCAVPESGRP